MIRSLGIAVLVSLFGVPSLAQEPVEIPLWNDGAPGFESRKDEKPQAAEWWVRNVHNPTITAYLPDPDKATGAAVIVCPGGGHKNLVFNAEGAEPAEYLQKMGVAAFALKYRLGREENSPYKIEVHAKEDAYRAMRLVRSRAEEWKIDPKRVGMLGFSAGGEVVSMVSYEPGEGDANAADPIDRLNGKPDFQMLVYPGPIGIPETIPADAPPAFLLVANDDRGAARTIASLFLKYREANRPVEVHVFAQGKHAFNMGNRSKLVSIKSWPQRMADWMADNDILTPPKTEAAGN
jgi:acetyl esterase/lipase